MSTEPVLPPVPAELAERLRRPAPAGCSVIPGSLPVPSFGNPAGARVVTLSTNPSKLELTTPRGTWLADEHRRVESLRSLGVQSPAELTDAQLAQVLHRAHTYFAHHPNRGVFDDRAALLGDVPGAGRLSYEDGTLAHLDLVQWPTNPVWSGLVPEVREKLVDADVDVLLGQLRDAEVPVVLVDGEHVTQWLTRAEVVTELVTDEIGYRNSRGNLRTMHLTRADTDGPLILGLQAPASTPLSPEGTELRRQWLGEQLATRLG